MATLMKQTLNSNTPILAVVDARRLLVRMVNYCRTQIDDAAEVRVDRQLHDAGGRAVKQWDPRLWALAESDAETPANQSTVRSLSGQDLASSNVDAGWRVNLVNDSGQTICRWDGRKNQSRFEYDLLLRPVAVFEQVHGESERCVERLRYAGTEASASNLCGQLMRHDDPAGSLHIHEASLQGAVLRQSQHFLALASAPDWPKSVAQCDALLEPGGGAVTLQHYNALNDLLSLTDARGHCRRSAYDVAGQLHRSSLQLAGQAEAVLLSTISYNTSGQIEREVAGDAAITTARYSPIDGRLEQLLALKPDGTRLQDLTYTSDPVGNILSIEDGVQAVRYFNNQRIASVSTYRYDSLSRLIEVTGREAAASSPDQFANYTQSYNYDAGGNLVRLQHVGAHSHTREMQIAAISNRGVVKNQGDPDTAFDANGNVQQLQPGQALAWDLRNQLRQVTPVERTEAANDTERYAYDSAGQRVRKTRFTQARNRTHQAEVRYLPGLELRTNTATGEVLHVINVTVGRSGVRVLHWESEPPAEMTNDRLSYSLSDHLGSSSLELDGAGRLISQEGYYPDGATAWWASRSEVEASYKTVRYSGKERDATGLYYFGFRYYAPWLNRWINPDPAGVVDGLNLFRMVRNNPLRYRDGDGRLPEEYSEYPPSAMVSGYHLNPKTFRRRDVTEQTAAVREKAVEDGFSHNIPYDAHRIVTDEAIRSIPYGYFENEYLPGRWRMLENFRSAGNGPNATDVTWYQYKQVSKLNNFYGVMPKVILRWNVINEDALRATEKPEGIRERFLASKGNGRSTQRIMDAFGLQATRVERVNIELPEPMNDRVLIAVHVEPKPEYRDLAYEALHAKVEKELRRASRNPISRAAHAVWRTAKRAVLPAHTNIGHR